MFSILGIGVSFKIVTDKDLSCKDKLPHKSLEAANKAAASFSEKKQAPYEGYKCRYCDFWHVGRKQGDF